MTIYTKRENYIRKTNTYQNSVTKWQNLLTNYVLQLPRPQWLYQNTITKTKLSKHRNHWIFPVFFEQLFDKS